MDYVVFGTGYGATLMLLGWILRTFGPDFRYRLEDDAEPPGGDFILARMSWRRFSAGLGALIATAGMMFVFITFVLILINPDNSTGTWVLVASLALVLIAAAAWSWLYVGQYGASGIVPEPKAEDEMPATPDEAAPEPAMTNMAVHGVVPVIEGSGPLPVGMADDNDLYAGPDDADDDAMAERQIRMSRYQAHGPGPQPADAPDEVAAEDVGDPASTEEESAGIGDDEFVAGEMPDEDDVVDEHPEGDDPDEDEPAAEDEARSVDGEPDEDEPEVEGKELTIAGDRDPVGVEDLEDTPEARAEALRRIQSWNPGEPDES